MTGSGLFNFNQPITKTGQDLKAFAKVLDDMIKQWDQTKLKFLQQEQTECRAANRIETTTTTTTPSTTTVKQSSNSPLTTTTAAPSSATKITTTTAAPLTPGTPVIVKAPTNCSQSAASTRQNPIPALNGYTRKTMTDFGVQVPRLRPLITSLWIGLNFNPFTQKGAALFNYNEDVATVAANLKLLSAEIAKMAVEWEQMVTVKTCPEPVAALAGTQAVQNATKPAAKPQ